METRPPVIDMPPVRRIWWMVPLLAAIVSVVLVYAAFDPAQSAFFPKCGFHAVTGLDCPGCGGQRALHQLLHGNVAGAIRYNALLVFLLPLGLWTLIRNGVQFITGRSLSPQFCHPAWTWVLAGSVVIFGILRNLPLDRLPG